MKDYLDGNDVMKVYQETVVPNILDAFKYVPLPMHRNNKKWKWEGKDFPRVIALLEFEEYMKNNNSHFKKALCFNGADDPEFEYITADNTEIIHYEKDPVNNDLHNLNLPDRDYDFCMLNQTLEHLYDPGQCIKNIYKHLRSGGTLYCNVPVINIPHMTPYHHYSGITPVGLGALVTAAGFKIETLGAWGNKEYILKLFDNLDWPDYRQLLSPGQNDPGHEVITWVVATK